MSVRFTWLLSSFSTCHKFHGFGVECSVLRLCHANFAHSALNNRTTRVLRNGKKRKRKNTNSIQSVRVSLSIFGSRCIASWSLCLIRRFPFFPRPFRRCLDTRTHSLTCAHKIRFESQVVECLVGKNAFRFARTVAIIEIQWFLTM